MRPSGHYIPRGNIKFTVMMEDGSVVDERDGCDKQVTQRVTLHNDDTDE